MYAPLQFKVSETQKSDGTASSAEPSLMIERMERSSIGLRENGILLATNSSLPLLNPRRKCCFIEKKAGLLARVLSSHTPSHANAQWTLYGRLHLQLRGQLRHLPNSLLNHYWYLFIVYTLYIVFYIITNLTYSVFSYN